MKARYKNTCTLHATVINLLVETIGIKTLNKVTIDHYEDEIRQIIAQIKKIDLICNVNWYNEKNEIVKVEGEQLPF